MVNGSGLKVVQCCVGWNSDVGECELRVSLHHLFAAGVSFLTILILFSHLGKRTIMIPIS